MHKIESDEMSPEFYELWKAAATHLDSLVQGEDTAWRRRHSNPPFLEHLALRLGNQNFFVRIRDADGRIDEGPGSLNGLLHVAEQNGAYPCLLLMRKDQSTGEWRPAYPGYWLADVRTGKPINPRALVTEERIPMTPWEIHSMGVQIVFNNLREEGYRITSCQDDPNVDPTLFFETDDGQIEWVVVRVVAYPAHQAERPANWAAIAKQLSGVARAGHFASVALASTEQPFESDDEPAVPLWRGQGLLVSYSGLE